MLTLLVPKGSCLGVNPYKEELKVVISMKDDAIALSQELLFTEVSSTIPEAMRKLSARLQSNSAAAQKYWFVLE